MNRSLIAVIDDLEQYATNHKLNHRFVGGVSFGGLINPDATYQIDSKRKTIRLTHHNPLRLTREDGSIKDIDIIIFCDDKTKVEAFFEFIDELKSKYHPCPIISVEPTIYPSLGKRNPRTQFVTALEVDGNNQLSLAYDSIAEPISWESVESWTVVLEKAMSYTVRNPIADFYAYSFRSPAGVKPKDRIKYEYLRTLAAAVYADGAKHHINYYSDDYYKPWQHFVTRLDTTTDTRIRIKKTIMKLYWSTIGTWFAHGKGAAKAASGLHNKFTGMSK